MKHAKPMFAILTLTLIVVVASPREAQAYIGPGVGMTAIGTLLAFVGAVFFALVGFVWYPIKRLIAAVKGRSSSRRQSEKASVS